MKLLSSLFLVCLTLFGLSACSSHGPVNGIDITLTSAQPVPGSKLAGQCQFAIQFQNGNVIPIAIEHSSHKIFLNGVYVGKAMGDKPIGLPPLKTVADVITLTTSNPKEAQELQAAAARGQVSYRIESTLLILSGEEKITVKTSNEGTIDLHAILR